MHTTVSEEKKEEDTSIKLEADETLDIPNTHKTKTNQEVSQELLYGSYDVQDLIIDDESHNQYF